MPRPTNFVAFIRNVVRDQVQEAVQGLLAGTRATPSTAVYIRKRYLIKGFHYPGGPGAGWREATLDGGARRGLRGRSTPGESASPPRCRS